MTLPPALLRDPAYRKALKLCNSISEHRFALAALAYDRREENYLVTVRVDGEDKPMASWSDVICAAEGIAIKTAQERAQVGEFMNRYHPKTNRYSRVSSAVRYRGVIKDNQLVEMIEDDESYPTVQDLQSALWQVAYGNKEFTPIVIARSLSRMANSGAALLGLNGQLPEYIRRDVQISTARIGRALRFMKDREAK